MKTTGTYIKQLLYTRRSVTIPGLGCILSSYRPSQIVQTNAAEGKDLFLPPAKNLTFDESIQTDDGLLTSFAARSMNITLQEAEQLVSADVAEVKALLKQGQSVGIEHVGILSSDAAGKMNLKPDTQSNLLAEAYGLQQFEYPILGQKQATVVTDNATKTKKVVVINYRPFIWAAAILLLLISLVLIYTQTDWFQRSGKAIAGWFKSDADTTQKVAVIDSSKIKKQPVDSAKLEALKNEKDSLNDKYAGKTKFYVITGSFTEESNAKKYVRKMNSMGYNNTQVLPRESGFYRVSVYLYGKRDSAITQLDAVRKRVKTDDVWVLSK